MIPATVQIILPYTMLEEQRFASPRVVRRMYVMSFSHHYHYTTMSRNARPVFIVHCLHHCRTAIPNSAALVVVPLRATRASRRTCVYYGEKRNTHTLILLALPTTTLSLSLSLFAFAPARITRASISLDRVCLHYTLCIHPRDETEEENESEKETNETKQRA